jgi:glycosyltransferase involved in cell wall biosynthesis
MGRNVARMQVGIKPEAGGYGLRILVMNSARKFIGEAAHCLALSRELRARGHDVLLALRAGFEPAKRARAEGLPLMELRMRSGANLRSDVGDLLALWRISRQQRFDIIHCHRGKDHWLGAALVTLTPVRAPLVRTRHVVMRVKDHAANRWLYGRRTQRVIAVSEAAAAGYGSLRGRLEGRLSIVHSAVDLEGFAPAKRSKDFRRELGVEPDQQLVGLIARYQRVKGPEVFLQAAARLAASFPNARFLLAGRGSEGKALLYKSIAAQLGVGDRAIFRGWFDDVATAVASLDVGVVASLGSEGSSRIAYEYMGSGVPTVATRVGVLPEIIEDEQNGLLVVPGDPDALADAIGRVLSEKALAQRLAAAALQRVQTEHNYDRWISDIVAIYQSAIEDMKR